MKRLTGRYENGNAYYDIIPGVSVIERLADIEDILGNEYNLEHLRDLIKENQELEYERQTKRFDLPFKTIPGKEKE